MNRRRLLQGLGAAALAPFANLLPAAPAYAGDGVAERVIFFYFPDGVVGPSANGEPSKWHCTGSEFGFTLSEQLQGLAAFQGDCVFLNGLSMGGTDSGSHPGGAKKLLTAVDHGNGESIDQYLSRTVGSGMPWRHLYLGAQATINGASGDKHISYYAPGQSIAPQDDPRVAFDLLFGAGAGGTGTGTGGVPVDPVQASVIDGVLADMNALRSKLGSVEKTKLDLHLDALFEVEQRIKGLGQAEPVVSCESPAIDTAQIGDLNAPESFPAILDAQLDLMVLAMACGLTRVGTIQASTHTSELIMSRFAGTAMYDPGFDMRSHQASHYGPAHDPNHREYADYLMQRQWWVEQFAGLLQRLADIPEGDGTMLDHSLVVLCTEVCDGNTHLHDNMPFVLAGRAGGCLSTGRLVDVGYRRHGDLWVSVANAMGDGLAQFGDASGGAIPGLLS